MIDELHIDPERLVVVPNAVDPSGFSIITPDARADARKMLDLPADATVAAFIGSLSEEKRPADAVRAVAALPETHLVIAGDGPLRGEIESLATIVGCGRVHLLGSIARTREVLAAADVLLLPSQTEGMPAVAIEAALVGIPVVGTNVGDVAEVVTPDSGLLVDVGDVDALAEGVSLVLEGHVLLEPERARRRSLEEFSLDAVADPWSRVLDGVD